MERAYHICDYVKCEELGSPILKGGLPYGNGEVIGMETFRNINFMNGDIVRINPRARIEYMVVKSDDELEIKLVMLAQKGETIQ